MSLFCTKCGSPLDERARFCAACGNPIQAAVQQPAQQPVQQPTNNYAAPAQSYAPQQPAQRQQYNYAAPNSQQPYSYAPNGQPTYGAAPQKSKKGLIIGVSVAAAVVIVGVVLLIVLLGGGKGGASSPEDLVKEITDGMNGGYIPTDLIYECVYAKDENTKKEAENSINLDNSMTYTITLNSTEPFSNDEYQEILALLPDEFYDVDKVEKLIYANVTQRSTIKGSTGYDDTTTAAVPMICVNGRWYLFLSPMVVRYVSSSSSDIHEILPPDYFDE